MQKSYSKLGISVLAGAAIGVCCAAGPAAAYNVYYGHLHNHSNVSDGTGTPAQAYAYARDTAGLDFFALADHAEQISSTENGQPSKAQRIPTTATAALSPSLALSGTTAPTAM